MKVGGQPGLTLTLHEEQEQSHNEIGPATPSASSRVDSAEHHQARLQAEPPHPNTPDPAGHTRQPRTTLA